MLQKGVLTGSRKFNVPSKHSDYDIIILEKDVPTDLKEKSWDYTVCFDASSGEPDGADGIDIDDIESWYEGSDVWGSTLDRIIKYFPQNLDYELKCVEDVQINLFVYDNSHTDVLDKFRVLNAKMLFTLTREQLAHKPTRVERFAELLTELKINEG